MKINFYIILIFLIGGPLIAQEDSLITSIENRDIQGNPPLANFIASQLNICPNQTIQFQDKSLDNWDQWYWEFEGGLPPTSAEENPIVIYDHIGSFDVELTVYNEYGSSKIKKLNNVVVAYPYEKELNITEDFEEGMSSDWNIMSSNDDFSWELDSTVGGYGLSNHSIVFNNYTYNAPGSEDSYISPSISFENKPVPKLYFDYAYSTYMNLYFDTLEIRYSDDCGESQHSIWKKGGTELATADSTSSIFIPTEDQWATVNIDLAAIGLAQKRNLTFYFININNYGNYLYLDNIMFDDLTSIKPFNEEYYFSVFPNPTENWINIQTNFSLPINVHITNLLGQEVIQLNHYDKSPISVQHLEKGLYIITITEEGQTLHSEKLMIK